MSCRHGKDSRGDSSGNFSKELWSFGPDSLGQAEGCMDLPVGAELMLCLLLHPKSCARSSLCTLDQSTCTRAFRLLEGLVVILGGSLSKRSGAEPRGGVISSLKLALCC